MSYESIRETDSAQLHDYWIERGLEIEPEIILLNNQERYVIVAKVELSVSLNKGTESALSQRHDSISIRT